MTVRWKAHVTNLVTCALLMLVACVLASIYGALHNQVSYTVSPEAFVQIYFFQFGVERGGAERWDAALIGIRATWWMGLYIGGVLAPLGIFFGTSKSNLWNVIRAYGVVAATVATTYLLALIITHFVSNLSFRGELLGAWFYFTLNDEYDRALITHDASYLGGFLGIALGAKYLLNIRKKYLGVESRGIVAPSQLDAH